MEKGKRHFFGHIIVYLFEKAFSVKSKAILPFYHMYGVKCQGIKEVIRHIYCNTGVKHHVVILLKDKREVTEKE